MCGKVNKAHEMITAQVRERSSQLKTENSVIESFACATATYLVVLDRGTIRQRDSLVRSINAGDLGIVLLLLLRQQRRHLLPDSTSAAFLGETEHSVGAPVVLSLVSSVFEKELVLNLNTNAVQLSVK